MYTSAAMPVMDGRLELLPKVNLNLNVKVNVDTDIGRNHHEVVSRIQDKTEN